jgi:protein phosphatase
MTLDGSSKICARTHSGLKRKENQDSHLVINRSTGGIGTEDFRMVLAVADGMGGHAAGLKASRMACEGLRCYYDQHVKTFESLGTPEAKLMILEEVIRNIHADIHSHAEVNQEDAGMGTTLSVLVVLGNVGLLAHVGDSRIYRLRDSVLEQLTEDQTMAQLSVEMGYLQKDEAIQHPLRHMLTDAVGLGVDDIQTGAQEVRKGDTLLLCSDGLHHQVSDGEIKAILERSAVGGVVCDGLIQAAMDRGGEDNITVIVLRV